MDPISHFEVQIDGPVTILKFTVKNLNENNVQQIGAEVAQYADRLGQGELQLDFSAVEYLSTVVMSRLVTLHKRVTRDGGRFVLTNVDALYELFSVTRLDSVMELRRKKE